MMKDRLEELGQERGFEARLGLGAGRGGSRDKGEEWEGENRWGSEERKMVEGMKESFQRETERSAVRWLFLFLSFSLSFDYVACR